MNNKNTDPKICFATNLKKFMELNKVSRNKLSADLDIKYSTICEWLKGTMLPRADKMEIVANYFNTTSSKLLEDPNAEVLVYKYPFVKRIPSGYTLEQASSEFFSGWGMISHMKDIKDHYGIVLQKECNPTQPHYANGEPVSFVLTNRITEFDKDYLIRRNGHDAEIVRIYRDPKENKFIKYIMVPVYNEEENYSSTYEYNEDELDCEIIGINME